MPSQRELLQRRAALQAFLGERAFDSVVSRSLRELDTTRVDFLRRMSESEREDYVIALTLSGFGINPQKLDDPAMIRAVLKSGTDISPPALRARMRQQARGKLRAQLDIEEKNDAMRAALAQKLGAARADDLIRLCITQWVRDPQFARLSQRSRRAKVLRALCRNHGVVMRK